MATAAEPQLAELPLPGGRFGSTVRLQPLLSGLVDAPPGFLHRGVGRLAGARALGLGVPREELVKVPIVAFLIEHPRAGRVLVDTGLHPSVGVDPKQNLGRLGARLFKGVELEQSLPDQLRARGVDPASIGVVVLTHLHLDHASAVSEFPEATFVLDGLEWEVATERRAALHGYVRRQFDHAFDYRTLDFDADWVESFATFGRAVDLFGDGSVRLVATPGHTHGHLSVIARLSEREALLTGDAVFTMRTLRDSHLPWRVEDEHLYRRSLKEIQHYVEQTPDALVVPGHDIDHWHTLEAVYE